MEHGGLDTGIRTVHHLPEPHSSDGLTSDDESDFETEPLETSSSSDQLTDSGEEMLNVRHRYQHRCHTPSSSEDSVVSKEVPDWFQDKAFLYSGRMSVLAIPGMLLVLLFSGDTLLFLVTVGSLIVYLLYNAGNKQKALFAYLAMFIAIQLTVVYSVVPLLWKSILNLIVILALNVYTFMTGGWILLLFEDFRFHDVDLLILIETGLFSLYPCVFVVLVTWSVAVVTMVSLAPYVLMLVGFVVLQVFLSPTTSSFVKPHPQGSIAVWDLPTGYILDHNAVAAITILYTLASPFVVIIIKAMNGWRILFSLFSLVQILFVTSCSIFLSSFINLRLFMDAHDIRLKHLLILRWSSAFVAMALVVPLLIFLEIQSNLLPWLPFILAVYVSIILCHLQRHKAAVQGSLVLLLLGFFLLFCQLPWNLKYFVAHGSVSITWLQLVLAFNACFCVVVVYSAIYWSNDAVGLGLQILSACHAYAGQVLLSSDLTSFLPLLIVASVFCYLSIRLYHSNKLSWQHSLLISSVHLTSLSINVGYFCPDLGVVEYDHQNLTYSGKLLNAYDFVSTLLLFVVVLRIVLYEQRTDISNRETAQYLLLLTCALLCNTPFLLTNLLKLLLRTQPAFSAYLGFICLVINCLYIKMVCVNNTVASQSKYYIVALVTIPVLALLLQPQLSLKSEELQKWSAIIGLSCILIALPLASLYRNSLHVVGACLGVPLAFCCLHLLFPSHPSLLIRLSQGADVTLSVILLLVAWQNPRHSKKWIRTLGLMIGMTNCALVVLEKTVMTVGQSNFSISSSIISCAIVAMVIKVRSSEFEESQLDGRLERDHQFLGLAVLGNVNAVSSYMLFALQAKSSAYWYLLLCLFSPVLLLLNKDPYLFSSLSPTNRFSPVAMVVTLVLAMATAIESRFFVATTTLGQCIGFLELLSLLCSMPVMVNFWTVCWWNGYWWSDKLVVFLTPVYFLFFFLGYSYASWTLGAVGLCIGFWLMKYKLPLEIDR